LDKKNKGVHRRKPKHTTKPQTCLARLQGEKKGKKKYHHPRQLKPMRHERKKATKEGLCLLLKVKRKKPLSGLFTITSPRFFEASRERKMHPLVQNRRGHPMKDCHTEEKNVKERLLKTGSGFCGWGTKI